jgi:hypothetical protein
MHSFKHVKHETDFSEIIIWFKPGMPMVTFRQKG